MDLIIIGIVSFLSGIMASMGLGGGMVLILYLSAINGLDQLSSQGINLLFFIPIGIFSVILIRGLLLFLGFVTHFCLQFLLIRQDYI